MSSRQDSPVYVSQEGLNLSDRVVKINRCATVVKGGRRFSFSALVVVGGGPELRGHRARRRTRLRGA
mgnify:CR=1 FL=1